MVCIICLYSSSVSLGHILNDSVWIHLRPANIVDDQVRSLPCVSYKCVEHCSCHFVCVSVSECCHLTYLPLSAALLPWKHADTHPILAPVFTCWHVVRVFITIMGNGEEEVDVAGNVFNKLKVN